MADFKIVDVFTQDGQLIVKAEHYHATGSLWFVENYTWQGREGLKQKRATNALGQLLLSDNSVAPSRIVRPGLPDVLEQYLPTGAQWKYRPGPHMDEASILSVIASIHQQRLAAGWPQGQVDVLRRFKPTQEDEGGIVGLTLGFQSLKGRIV